MSGGWCWSDGGTRPPDTGGMVCTDEWGWRTWTSPPRNHDGIDLVVYNYTNRAAADGVVTFAGYNGGAGNEVRIAHPGGTETRYKHNAYFASGIAVGARVVKGQAVGRMGTTGDSTGDHLHFETRMTSASGSMNPRDFMAARIAESPATGPAGGGGVPFPGEQEDDMIALDIVPITNADKTEKWYAVGKFGRAEIAEGHMGSLQSVISYLQNPPHKPDGSPINAGGPDIDNYLDYSRRVNTPPSGAVADVDEALLAKELAKVFPAVTDAELASAVTTILGAVNAPRTIAAAK